MTYIQMQLKMAHEAQDKINKQNLELAVESEVLYSKPIKLTIKQYFKALLLMLIDDRELLSGGRPFWSSDWEREIKECLIKNKVVKTAINEHGEEYCEDSEFYRHICEMIKSM